MKKFICYIFIQVFIFTVSAESVSTFLGIPFGTDMVETTAIVMNKGWSLSEKKDSSLTFSGGELNYDNFVLFDKIVLSFTKSNLFYHARVVLLDKDNNTNNFNNYINKIIKDYSLNFVSNENKKITYVSSDGKAFSYQIYDDSKVPFMVLDKSDPLLFVDEENSEFENIAPSKCMLLQKGSGVDFYYMVSEVPYSSFDVVYLCKSNNFDSVVYICFYPDPTGIRIGNFVDSHKNEISLDYMIHDCTLTPHKVSWCKKLIYYSVENNE